MTYYWKLAKSTNLSTHKYLTFVWLTQQAGSSRFVWNYIKRVICTTSKEDWNTQKWNWDRLKKGFWGPDSLLVKFLGWSYATNEVMVHLLWPQTHLKGLPRPNQTSARCLKTFIVFLLLETILSENALGEIRLVCSSPKTPSGTIMYCRGTVIPSQLTCCARKKTLSRTRVPFYAYQPPCSFLCITAHMFLFMLISPRCAFYA